jgi:hypothetical protein
MMKRKKTMEVVSAMMMRTRTTTMRSSSLLVLVAKEGSEFEGRKPLITIYLSFIAIHVIELVDM